MQLYMLTSLSRLTTLIRGGPPREDPPPAPELGRLRARRERDRTGPVRLHHAVAPLPQLQRAVALLAADADARLRDLHVRRARVAAARRPRLGRGRPPARPPLRARRIDGGDGAVHAR